jgi:hypothetical protein
MLSGFMQVLHSKRKHPTKYYYFSTHIQFTMIYLLQEHILKYNNYSEQQINMRNFVHAKYYDMIMYENFQ